MLLALLLLPALPALPTPTAQACSPRTEPFTFAILADTHVGRGQDAETLKEALLRILQLDPVPRLVLVAGDLTDSLLDHQAAEYRRIMAQLPMPVFDVQGNHDVGFLPTPGSLERFYRLMGRPHLPDVLTVEGRHFVGFDSQLLNTRRLPPEPGDIGFAHLDLLEQLLASLPPGPVFLLHHIPTVENVVRGRAKHTWHAPFLRRFREILERYPVTAVISGHFHRDELHFVAGAPLLVCPAISNKYGYIPSFRVVMHDERGLRFRQIYLGPRGTGRSYVTDLRDVDLGAFRRMVASYDEAELGYIWRRRYTGMVSVAASQARRFSPERIRQLILSDPTADVLAPLTLPGLPAATSLRDDGLPD